MIGNVSAVRLYCIRIEFSSCGVTKKTRLILQMCNNRGIYIEIFISPRLPEGLVCSRSMLFFENKFGTKKQRPIENVSGLSGYNVEETAGKHTCII